MVASASKSARPCRPACLVLLLAATVVSLSPNAAAARTWHVPGDAPTIQAGIDSAMVMDDVLVAPGEYFEHGIRLKGGVWLHSELGASGTVVDGQGLARVFDCGQESEPVVVDGLTIRNGRATGQTEEEGSGGGIRSLRTPIEIRSCVISGCSTNWYGGGLYARRGDVVITDSEVKECTATYCCGGVTIQSDGSVRVLNTIVSGNEAGTSVGGFGVRALHLEVAGCVFRDNIAYWGATGGLGVSSTDLSVRDCLVVRNLSGDYGMAGGLGIDGSHGFVRNVTIVDNGGSPPPAAVSVSESDVQFGNVILAFNYGSAVECLDDCRLAFRCCDTFANSYGNELPGDDLGGNISLDPLFCDREGYELDGASPCLPGWEHGGIDCGLIGARGQGCGSAPTGACCFADGACAVLDLQSCADQGGAYQGNGTTCDPNPCQATPTKPTTWGRIKAGYR